MADNVTQSIKFLADTTQLTSALDSVIKKYSNITLSINAKINEFSSTFSKASGSYNSAIEQILRNNANLSQETINNIINSLGSLDKKILARTAVNRMVTNQTALDKMDKVDLTRVGLNQQNLNWKSSHMDDLFQQQRELKKITEEYNLQKRQIIDITALEKEKLRIKDREARYEKKQSERGFFGYRGTFRNIAVIAASMYGTYKMGQYLLQPTFQAERATSTLSNILPIYGDYSLGERNRMAKRSFKEMYDYGLDLRVNPMSYMRAYSGFMASKLNGVDYKGQNDIAKSLLKYFSVMNLDSEQITGSFLAFSQMASKGIVSMEEARRQISNHIPGAWNLMADAMGMTTSQLEEEVRKGTLRAEVLMTNLSKHIQKVYGDIKPANNLVGAFNVLAGSINKMLIAFGQSDAVRNFFLKFTNGIITVSNALSALMPILSRIIILLTTLWGFNKLSNLGASILGVGGKKGFIGMYNSLTNPISMGLAKGGTLLANSSIGAMLGMSPRSALATAQSAKGFRSAFGKIGIAYALSSIVGGGIEMARNKYFEGEDAKEGGWFDNATRIADSASNYAFWGATIGSVVPGAGTLVGAGVGAFAGTLVEILDILNGTQKTNEKIEQNTRPEGKGSGQDWSKVAIDPSLRGFEGVKLYKGSQV